MNKPLNMEIQEILGDTCKVALTLDDSSNSSIAQTLILSGMVKEGKNPNEKGNKAILL